MANTEHRRLAAIMFTDMVGYSALAQRNEALALELLHEHHRLLRGILPRFQGQDIKSTGDGLLIEFASALAAVQCAVEIQRAMAERNQSEPVERQVRIRIGIHLGDVVRRDNDVFGDGVNIAARIEPLAEPGGICLTRAVYEQTANKVDHPFVQLSRPGLKNIQAAVEVYKLVLDGQRATKTSVRRGGLMAVIVIGPIMVFMAVAFTLIPKFKSHLKNSIATTSRPAVTSIATNASEIVSNQKSVAVLPFVNMSSDKDNEYLSDGITEDILNALAKVPDLHVPARTSAFVFKGKNEDVRKIGELLHVGTVLEGSVQRSGDRLRITVQLINVADGFHLWSEQFDRGMKDVFAIQDEISRTIVEKLKVTFAGNPATTPVKHGTENIEAYQLYLKGRFHASSYTRENLLQAIGEFEQAVAKQPDYARAYAEMAYTYGVLMFFGYSSPETVGPKMQAASEKALELDDSLAAVYVLRGSFRLYMKWDWQGAEEAFKHAVELEPANPDAHRSYADYFNATGRFQEALAEITIARHLDPLAETLKLRESWIYYRAGEYDKTVELARKILSGSPDDPSAHELVANALFRKGQHAEAIAEMEKVTRLDAGPMALATLGRMYGRAGRKADAQKILGQLLEMSKQVHVPASSLAEAYEGIGDFEQANAWMNKAIENREGTLVYLKSNADELNRANPHFTEWLRKIGLEK